MKILFGFTFVFLSLGCFAQNVSYPTVVDSSGNKTSRLLNNSSCGMNPGIGNYLKRPTAAYTRPGDFLFDPDSNRLVLRVNGGYYAIPVSIDLSAGSGSRNADSIQGIPVSATAPTTGQVLQSNGSSYTPVTITSGTYTPTLTATANVSSVTLSSAYYTVVGNVVHIQIYGNFLITALNTNSQLTFTLPLTTSNGSQTSGGPANVLPDGGNYAGIAGYAKVLTTTTGAMYFYATGIVGAGSPFVIHLDYTL